MADEKTRDETLDAMLGKVLKGIESLCARIEVLEEAGDGRRKDAKHDDDEIDWGDGDEGEKREKGEPKELVADHSRAKNYSDSNAQIQFRADQVANVFGEKAAPPMQSERPLDFLRRTLKPLQRHSTEFSSTNLNDVPSMKLLTPIARSIFHDALEAAKRPSTFIPDDANLMRQITRHDSGGHTFHEFFGKRSFVRQFTRPARRVTGMPALADRGK